MVPIEITTKSIKHLGSEYYYIRHIFNALRENKDLLEIPDYKRLYDEAHDFLFRYIVKECGWDENKREAGYFYLEFLADLNNSDDDEEKYSMETVNYLLEKRRKIWNS